MILNKMWAGGNAFLVLNTVFGIFQAWNATLLVWEIPLWLRHNKVQRVFSLGFGFLYNLILSTTAYKFFYDVYYETKVEPFDMFVSMVIAYNLILHGPILFLNMVIIMKEFSLENFQLLTGSNNNYSLGYADAKRGLKDLFWFMNPFTYVDIALTIVYWILDEAISIIFHRVHHPNMRH
jgi:hypothetical protein